MGRKVVCKICKTKGDSDIFHKVTNERGTNSYYCNKDEYDNLITKQQNRYELLKYVAEEVLEYDNGQIVPPSMVKKIGSLNEFYDFEVIHETFRQSKDTIQYWINNKNFTSEYGMASYVMKIIEGNINDIYKSWKYKKQQEQTQLNKINNKVNDVNMMNELNDHPEITQPKVKSDDGIMAFLDDGDV